MQSRLRKPRRVAAAAVLAAISLTGCGGNLGDDRGSEAAAPYPQRAVSLLVGQDAGGSTDLIARASPIRRAPTSSSRSPC